MMKFYYSGNNKIKNRLKEDELFADLCDFLLQHPDSILRELKREFPQKRFDRLLDGAIEAALITREERRYRLSFPFYEAADMLGEEIKEREPQLVAELAALSPSEKFPVLFQLLDSTETEEFLGLSTDFPIIKSWQAGNDVLTFLSISRSGEETNDLAAYFRESQREELPEFKELLRLIGDVDEEYFFDQAELILSRLQKGRQPRENIFVHALILGGVIERGEDDGYGIKMMVLPEFSDQYQKSNGFLTRQSLVSHFLASKQQAFILKK